MHRTEDNVWDINERFLMFEDCEKKKGKDIADLLCRVLQRNGIDLQHCRGQGYDNGSNMSGMYNGVQALILEHNPKAIFCPCSAHSLNLCRVHVAESSAVVKSFFGNTKNCTIYLVVVLLDGKFYRIAQVYLCIGYQTLVGVLELMQ